MGVGVACWQWGKGNQRPRLWSRHHAQRTGWCWCTGWRWQTGRRGYRPGDTWPVAGAVGGSLGVVAQVGMPLEAVARVPLEAVVHVHVPLRLGGGQVAVRLGRSLRGRKIVGRMPSLLGGGGPVGLMLVQLVGMPLMLRGREVGHGGEAAWQVGPQRLCVGDEGEGQGGAHVDQGHSGQGVSQTGQRVVRACCCRSLSRQCERSCGVRHCWWYRSRWLGIPQSDCGTGRDRGPAWLPPCSTTLAVMSLLHPLDQSCSRPQRHPTEWVGVGVGVWTWWLPRCFNPSLHPTTTCSSCRRVGGRAGWIVLTRRRWLVQWIQNSGQLAEASRSFPSWGVRRLKGWAADCASPPCIHPHLGTQAQHRVIQWGYKHNTGSFNGDTSTTQDHLVGIQAQHRIIQWGYNHNTGSFSEDTSITQDHSVGIQGNKHNTGSFSGDTSTTHDHSLMIQWGYNYTSITQIIQWRYKPNTGSFSNQCGYKLHSISPWEYKHSTLSFSGDTSKTMGHLLIQWKHGETMPDW